MLRVIPKRYVVFGKCVKSIVLIVDELFHKLTIGLRHHLRHIQNEDLRCISQCLKTNRAEPALGIGKLGSRLGPSAYSKRVPRTNCALRIKKCAPRISTKSRKYNARNSLSRCSNSTKIVFRWGFAPDPTGGAYSAPPDPLAGFKGPYF